MRRRRGERGTVLVETAIIAPVFLTIVFAIFEFGLVYRDYLTATDAVSDAARIGAIIGPDVTDAGTNADYEIITALRNGLAGLDSDSIASIVIYKGGPASTGSPDDQLPPSCRNGIAVAGVCNVYDPNAAFFAAFAADTAFFTCTDGTQASCPWDPTTRDDGPEPADIEYVGVWIEIDRRSVTGLFRDRWVIREAAVLQLEPGIVT